MKKHLWAQEIAREHSSPCVYIGTYPCHVVLPVLPFNCWLCPSSRIWWCCSPASSKCMRVQLSPLISLHLPYKLCRCFPTRNTLGTYSITWYVPIFSVFQLEAVIQWSTLDMALGVEVGQQGMQCCLCTRSTFCNVIDSIWFHSFKCISSCQ